MRPYTLALCLALVSFVAVTTAIAHRDTHKGSVIAVEKSGVRVNVVDLKTKKVAPRTFEVDKETKVLRDDKPVAFAAARIAKGEAIAVTVDHDIDEAPAPVIRLGTSK